MTIDCHNCGRVVADGLELCTLCADSLRRELLQVPGLVSDMTITRSRLDRMSRGRVGGKSAETALPVRLDKFDQRPTQRVLEHLTNTLTTWARAVADHAGLAEDLRAAILSPGLRQLTHNIRGKRRDPAALSIEPAHIAELAAVWLADYAGDLRATPGADELYLDVTDAIASVRRSIDQRPELSYRGQCTAQVADEHGVYIMCGADLYVERGESYVTCPSCRMPHDVGDIEHRALERENDRLCTLPELLAILRALGEPVPKSTLYAWANDPKRRRLDVRGWRTPNGMVTPYWIRRSDSPVYRLGDVRKLAAQSRGTVGARG
ncbi:hypothetical protein GS462_21725 [Rhodococcus hoagii]|nr:hypothetical protein [Prescottella equi]MBM4653017.1 hypothetical protein [Prescottella equi]MBM4687713.1 hypothetical protein [Prescottella equi]